MRKEVLEFLQKEKLVAVATIDENGNPWIANVFFGVDKDCNLYFESKRATKHSKHIEARPEIAFTVSSFNKESDGQKIAIQATGTAKLVTNLKDLSVGAIAIFQKFSDWKIDPKEALAKLDKAGMYKITPKYIKFWNDELLGKVQEEYEL